MRVVNYSFSILFNAIIGDKRESVNYDDSYLKVQPAFYIGSAYV